MGGIVHTTHDSRQYLTHHTADTPGQLDVSYTAVACTAVASPVRLLAVPSTGALRLS